MIGICKNYFDLFRFHTLSREQLLDHTVSEGDEHVERALARGRGLIMIAPHAGNYSVIFAPMIQRFNTRVLLVVEQMSDPHVHEVMNSLRRTAGVDIEPLGPHVGRTVLRALRQNHIVLLAGDRAIGENAQIVQFFGQPTPIPNGPATLALRTGAPLLTAYTQRMKDNRSYVRFDPPLLFERSASLQNDICDATQKIAYIMQAYIRRDPGQWLVAENVWPNA
jgi:KDO2-lipid IV(A) lauroyltransferase